VADSELAVILKLKDQITKPIASVASKVLSALGGAFSKTASAIFNVTRFIDHLTNVAKKMIGEFLKFGKIANELAPDAQKFIPNLSDQDAARVKSVAESYNKLGASIKSLFGHTVAGLKDEITGVMDAISSFLSEHKDDIITFVRQLISLVKDLYTLLKGISSGRIGFADFMPNMPKSVVAADSAWAAARAWLGGGGIGGAAGAGFATAALDTRNRQSLTQKIAELRMQDALAEFDRVASAATGKDVAAMRPGDIERHMNFVLEYMKMMSPELFTMGDAAEKAATEAKDLATSMGNEDGALTDSIEGATAALNKFKPKLAEVPSLAAEAQRVLVQLSEVAQTMADQMTDAFFAIIEKTKDVATAIKDMVAGIIKDIGRMLINRALMQLLSGLLGATDSGGAFTGIFGNNSPAGGGHASGGPVGAGRWTMVGERGPELVRFGSSARVYNASDSAQMAGGPSIVVNVSGGMSPAEVRRQARLGVLEGLQTSTQFRHQLRGNA